MMANPVSKRVSIIIVTYNSRHYLAACLDSILAQLTANDEVIVVDNDSTDGSGEFVRTHYPQVLLCMNQNTGYAGGNNRGAAQATGEYLVFLNPDTVLESGALEALIEPFSHDQTIGLTTACIVHMQRPDVINTCGNIMHYTGLTYCRGANQSVQQFQQATAVDAISGAAFAIRHTLFAQLGGFDPQFFMYVEDTDLSWRARLHGYCCWYTPEAIVKHDYHPTYSPHKAFYLERNRHFMLLKNLPAAFYWRMLPGLLLSECVTWGFMLIKGPRFWSIKFKVYHWLWREWRTIRKAHIPAAEEHLLASLNQMTHELEFGQLAHRSLAWLANKLFDPAFRLARRTWTSKQHQHYKNT